jgi:hypothetical protein
MTNRVSREHLISAFRNFWEARSTVNAFLAEHMAWFWTESQEPPPEPKAWTQEALEDLESLEAREQEVYEEWLRVRQPFGR